MDSLVDKVQELLQKQQQASDSLSKYLTTVIELLEINADKGVVIEHLRNVQKVLHNNSETYKRLADNGKDSKGT